MYVEQGSRVICDKLSLRLPPRASLLIVGACIPVCVVTCII